jgi:hypothetical protein
MLTFWNILFIFRYKLIDKDYFDFTYSLKQFYIFIYKLYYVSDQKTKQVSIFVRTYITRISQVQKLQDSNNCYQT